jgi:predicted Zn-dependent protease
MRLSPHEPRVNTWCNEIGVVHLLQSRTEEAISWLERARNDSPAVPGTRAWLAAAYALKGEIERAGTELAEARRLSADGRFSSLARYRASSMYRGVPKILALYETTVITGLRLAGMPEE